MVTKNPVFMKWSVKRFQATVINDIWPETLFFSLVATAVTLISKFTSTQLVINNQMLTVLGTVLGLVISFRTSSAYERYWEGRKLWTNINQASRNLAHLIWVHVPNDRPKKEGEEIVYEETVEQARLKAVIEKKSMINLVEAFSVSVKHALRGEAGIYYQDLYPLVSFLPRFASQPPMVDITRDVLPLWEASHLDDPKNSVSAASTLKGLSRTTSNPGDASEKDAAIAIINGENFAPDLNKKKTSKRHSDPEHILPVFDCDRELKPARIPPRTSLYDYIPLLVIFKPIIWIFKYMYRKLRRDKYASARPGSDGLRNAFGRKRKAEVIESSVPLEITVFLSSYLAWLVQHEYIHNVMTGSFYPIPSGYDGKLGPNQSNSNPLRVSSAPANVIVFETYDDFGYLTIPATAFASFLLLGFLEIGQEIEDPFGYDANDLDLDEFCACIHRELAEITAHTCPEPSSFLFESWNHPFAPGDNRSAKEMIENVQHEYHGSDTSMLSIRRTLLDSWRTAVRHKNS